MFECLKNLGIDRRPKKSQRRDFNSPYSQKRREKKRLKKEAKRLKIYNKKKQKSIPIRGYYAYMRSAEWHAKRVEAITFYGNACLVCKTDKRLHVHHKTYVRLGMEKMSDLAVLCVDCHRRLHAEHSAFIIGKPREPTSVSLLRFSNQFIQQK